MSQLVRREADPFYSAAAEIVASPDSDNVYLIEAAGMLHDIGKDPGLATSHMDIIHRVVGSMFDDYA